MKYPRKTVNFKKNTFNVIRISPTFKSFLHGSKKRLNNAGKTTKKFKKLISKKIFNLSINIVIL